MVRKRIQETLTTSDGTEGSLLIPKKIHDTLWPAVEKALLPRELAALVVGPSQIPGSSYDINAITPNTMNVREIGEGAEIWLDSPEFTDTNIKPLKYGVRIDVTEEMLEDAKWNLLQRAIEMAGKEFAENETSLILTQFASASNTITGGATLTIANMTRAMQYLEDADHTPTDWILGTEAVNDVRNINTFVEAQRYGTDQMMKTGFVGTIYGLPIYRFSTNAAPTTTWSKYAFVIDRKNAYVIVEKRPVTTRLYEHIQHDTRGVALTQRIAVNYLRADAICKITTT